MTGAAAGAGATVVVVVVVGAAVVVVAGGVVAVAAGVVPATVVVAFGATVSWMFPGVCRAADEVGVGVAEIDVLVGGWAAATPAALSPAAVGNTSAAASSAIARPLRSCTRALPWNRLRPVRRTSDLLDAGRM
ncbi:hypothetical protein ACWEJS_02020 [Rhodococcus triatomae]